MKRLPQLAPQVHHQTYRAGHHIGQVCNVLANIGIDPDLWSARDLEEAMDRRNRETRRDSLTRSEQRSPMGWLAYQLREILAHTTEAPGLTHRREQQARDLEARRRSAIRANEATNTASPVVASTMAQAAREAARMAVSVTR